MLNVIEGKPKKREMTIFEDFVEYCKEDNPRLAENIEIWLADYFDLPNRDIPLNQAERKWIKENLSKENQKRILGGHWEDYYLSKEIDETTNEIMDMIRTEFKLKEDSDKDDNVYGFIHNKIKELVEKK
jgi:hypothetical protein